MNNAARDRLRALRDEAERLDASLDSPLAEGELYRVACRLNEIERELPAIVALAEAEALDEVVLHGNATDAAIARAKKKRM